MRRGLSVAACTPYTFLRPTQPNVQRLGYLVGRRAGRAGRDGFEDAVVDGLCHLLALLEGKTTVELLDTASGADTTQQLGESGAHANAVGANNAAQAPTAEEPAATPSTALW